MTLGTANKINPVNFVPIGRTTTSHQFNRFFKTSPFRHLPADSIQTKVCRMDDMPHQTTKDLISECHEDRLNDRVTSY